VGIHFDMAVIKRRSLDKDFSFRMDSTPHRFPPPDFPNPKKLIAKSRRHKSYEDRGSFNSRRTSSTLP
jgi:hypothetical protein